MSQQQHNQNLTLSLHTSRRDLGWLLRGRWIGVAVMPSHCRTIHHDTGFEYPQWTGLSSIHPCSTTPAVRRGAGRERSRCHHRNTTSGSHAVSRPHLHPSDMQAPGAAAQPGRAKSSRVTRVVGATVVALLGALLLAILLPLLAALLAAWVVIEALFYICVTGPEAHRLDAQPPGHHAPPRALEGAPAVFDRFLQVRGRWCVSVCACACVQHSGAARTAWSAHTHPSNGGQRHQQRRTPRPCQRRQRGRAAPPSDRGPVDQRARRTRVRASHHTHPVAPHCRLP
jgi:hypothetical protein